MSLYKMHKFLVALTKCTNKHPNAQINIYGLVALKVWWKRDSCPAFEKQPTEKKSGQVVVRKRGHSRVELLKPTTEGNEPLLKSLWHHSDAVVCCSVKAQVEILYDEERRLDGMIRDTQEIICRLFEEENSRKCLSLKNQRVSTKYCISKKLRSATWQCTVEHRTAFDALQGCGN